MNRSDNEAFLANLPILQSYNIKILQSAIALTCKNNIAMFPLCPADRSLTEAVAVTNTDYSCSVTSVLVSAHELSQTSELNKTFKSISCRVSAKRSFIRILTSIDFSLKRSRKYFLHLTKLSRTSSEAFLSISDFAIINLDLDNSKIPTEIDLIQSD